MEEYHEDLLQQCKKLKRRKEIASKIVKHCESLQYRFPNYVNDLDNYLEHKITKLKSIAQYAGRKFHEIFVEYPKQKISKVLQLKQCEGFFEYLQEALFNVDGEVGNEMKKFMISKNIEEGLNNAPSPININITENKNTFNTDKSITYNMHDNKIDNSSLSTPITFSEAMDTS